MKNRIKNFLKNKIENCIIKYSGSLDCRMVYSQTGEDITIRDLLKIELNKSKISYLDIGANDPKFLSNTYLFYKEGDSGILVEPNPALCKKIQSVKKRDKLLNCGVSDSKGTLTYYMMDSDKINSFSKEEVDEYVKLGHKIIDTMRLPVVSINDILEEHGKVDFISIDVEGLDFIILKSLDYSKYAPLCICIETAEYGGTKRSDFQTINNFLKEKGYIIYADTMLNTIYVKENEYINSRRRNLQV